MKKILFFLTLLIIFLKIPTAHATTFYEGNYISNIWMHKKSPYDGLIYYNQAKFIRELHTNQVAYCIEPFTNLNEYSQYNNINPTNLTKNQIEEMTLIAHFGYGYANHIEDKWYAITQIMIWQIAEPNTTYYLSSTKDSPAILFEYEINEIKSLVNTYKNNTSFNNNTYSIVENNNLVLTDTNNVLNSFKVTTNNATINNNNLYIENLPLGTHHINLEKNSTLYNSPILFYHSDNSQDIIKIGDPFSNMNKLTVNVINTTININKIDKDSLSKTSQGDASLTGAIFELYTTKDQYIQDIIINEDNTTTIKNLNFGTYYLKEKQPGEGYNINPRKYYFTLSEKQQNINLNIFNNVIKGKLKIIKEYGYLNNFQPEQNISFNIYNKDNELIETIVTNELGEAEITLPYGKYMLKQLTTTEGYQKIEPIEFEITTNETIIKNLKNYKINVPNTKTYSVLTKIINLIRKLLCIKK